MQGGFKNRRQKGIEFEEEAVEYLKGLGYEIIEKNYNARFGEIDIVAGVPDEKTLVFVEVKAKDISTGIHPFEAVDARKQKNLIMAAREYMASHNIENTYIRFDVIGIISSGKEVRKLELLKDAFQA